MAELSPEHHELVTRLGGDFARALAAALPRIVEALRSGPGHATFGVSVGFKVKNEEVKVELQPRESIPVEPVVHKVSLQGDQLQLFSGAPVTPVPTREPVTPPLEAGESPGEVLARLGLTPEQAILVVKACAERDSTVDAWLAYVAKNAIPLDEAIVALVG